MTPQGELVSFAAFLGALWPGLVAVLVLGIALGGCGVMVLESHRARRRWRAEAARLRAARESEGGR